MLCHASSRSELMGKWVQIKYSSLRVEVSENGSNFLVTEFKEKASKKFPAKLIDGVLVVNNGPIVMNVDILKKSGYLLYNGQEYRRLKKGESFDYTAPQITRF